MDTIYFLVMVLGLSFLFTSPWVIIAGIVKDVRDKRREGEKVDGEAIVKSVFQLFGIMLVSGFVSVYCAFRLL